MSKSAEKGNLLTVLAEVDEAGALLHLFPGKEWVLTEAGGHLSAAGVILRESIEELGRIVTALTILRAEYRTPGSALQPEVLDLLLSQLRPFTMLEGVP